MWITSLSFSHLKVSKFMGTFVNEKQIGPYLRQIKNSVRNRAIFSYGYSAIITLGFSGLSIV